MPFKSYLTYMPGSSNYKRPDPFKTVGLSNIPKPNFGPQLSMVRPLYDKQVLNTLDLQMRKGLTQPDMTAYSQGNVGGKK
jgi:hypothetical protein